MAFRMVSWVYSSTVNTKGNDACHMSVTQRYPYFSVALLKMSIF